MYAILGATGNTGSAAAHSLLGRGAKVRAVVRNPNKAEALRAAGAELARAELGDATALTAALQGVRGVYVMLPPRVDAEDLLVQARASSDAIAQAVRTARVPHVVLLSSLGAHQPSGTGPILSNRYAEQVLREATPALSALRPPYFMENWGEALAALPAGKLISMLALDHAIPMIATEDIGRAAASVLLEGPRGHEQIELEGPARYTPRDVARALSAILGKPIEPELVPNAAIVSVLTGFGMSARNAELFREMHAAIDRDYVSQEARYTRSLRGEVGLEQVLRRLLASQG